MYIRANLAPELMGHITIPYNGNEFVFHRGCSVNINSILQTGLIAEERESLEGRQTIFFTPLNPFGDPDQEASGEDLSTPRKVHYHNNWQHEQDAVYWVKWSCAQDQGLRFRQDEIYRNNNTQSCAGSTCT